MDAHGLLSFVPQMKLQRVDEAGDAGLWIASLPWPRAAARAVQLDGQPTTVLPLGQWHGQSDPMPRRLLLCGDAPGSAPDTLSLGYADGTTPGAAARTPADVTTPLVGHVDQEGYYAQSHSLLLKRGEHWIELIMGLRHAGELHWWEAARVVTVRDEPDCRIIEMCGAIPQQHMDRKHLEKYLGYSSPLLHKHNWLYGRLYIRLHGNGVCEVFARHENSRYVDEGCDLLDVIPVVGMRAADVSRAPLGTWDGSVNTLDLGSVKLDVSEAARLASPQMPGEMALHEDWLVWQPYQGFDLFGGVCPLQLTGDPWLCRASEHRVPRGASRTVRFTLSLGNRSPRVVRYLPPYWWYGVTEELSGRSELPVSNDWDGFLAEQLEWVTTNIVRHGFDDGSVPRGLTKDMFEKFGRHEPGWEGDMPYGQLLYAYRTGTAMDYHDALRSAYHFTDIAVDHAGKLGRMHGFTLGAYALPMSRVTGPLLAYLETGDPYLRDTAEAVTEAAWRLHRNAWPRMSVGRDACFLRGAVMLYRYFNIEHFRQIALQGCLDVAQSQRPDGSFGDQGGGTGLHQWSAYIAKPWMGLLANNPLLDYLELLPEPRLDACVQRYGDWLMRERWERPNGGGSGWSYQHYFHDERRHFDYYRNQWQQLPHAGFWHHNNLARLLARCYFLTGEDRFLDAWAESQSLTLDKQDGDHPISASLQFLPALAQQLVGAKLHADGRVTVSPRSFGPRSPQRQQVFTPTGLVPVEQLSN